MSYQEKRTIVNLIIGVIMLAAYCIYALTQYQSGAIDPSDLKFWAITMLVFIGIGIVSTIVIQIIFHIMMAIAVAVKERGCDEKEIENTIEASVVEDEMDKLIELKSSRITIIFAGLGFVAGLISLALDAMPMLMLNIIFLSSGVGSLLEGVLSLRYYRRGVHNG